MLKVVKMMQQFRIEIIRKYGKENLSRRKELLLLKVTHKKVGNSLRIITMIK